MLTHTHTHTPHPHTPEGSKSGSSRGSAKGSSPSDMECGGSPGGVRAGAHNVDCDSNGSRAMVVQVQQVRQEFQAARKQQLLQMKEQMEAQKRFQDQMEEMKRVLAAQGQVAQRGAREAFQRHIADTKELIAPLVEAHKKACKEAHKRRVQGLSWQERHAAATKIQAAYRGLRRRAYEFGGCILRCDDNDVPQLTRLYHVHNGSFMRCVQVALHRRVWWDYFRSTTCRMYWGEMSDSEWRSAQWGWHRSVQRQCIFAVRDIDHLISQGVCSLEHVLRLRHRHRCVIDASFVQRVLASSDSAFGGRSPVAHEASASSHSVKGGGVSERGYIWQRQL